MKKKTRPSSSHPDAKAALRSIQKTLLVPFILAITVCLAGTVISLWLFFGNYFKSVSSDKMQIATITFKYKTAQRKLIARSLWDRLRQNSPVYNGDTIHTADISEATIHFIDGNTMDLLENTMAQVFLNEDNTFGAELMEGSATFDSTGAANGMTLTSSGTTILLRPGTVASGSSSEGGRLSVQVFEGSIQGEGMDLNASDGMILTDNGLEAAVLTVTSPKPNEKRMFHAGNSAPIPFEWRNTPLDEDEELLIELSPRKDFNEISRSVAASGLNSLSMDVGEGVWYWRIRSVVKGTSRAKHEEKVLSGRMQIFNSPPPELITPVNGYTYAYRARTPAVRLIWTDSACASSYQLLISKSPSMSNPVINQREPLTSRIISTLTEGTYYWQVTPFYSINNTGLEAPSQVGSFTVTKRGDLTAPELLLPRHNGNIDIANASDGIRFSWKDEREASAYRIRIYPNGRASSPLVNYVTSKNYYLLNMDDSPLNEGTWQWSVTQLDDEGNESPASDARTFYTMKGKLEQHTIEPADGYRVAETLMPDMQFTWKQNLPSQFKSTVQISTAPDFSKLSYSNKVNGSSMKGVSLSPGTYYWRLNAQNGEDVSYSTDPKSFVVMEQLDATRIIDPTSRAVSREGIPYQMKWQEVEGADFYKVIIYRSTDNAIVYEDNVYEATTELDMFSTPSFVDRIAYHWEIQAQANSIPGKASRLSGKLAEGSFNLYKLHPVTIKVPALNATIDGVDAVLYPVKITWDAVDEVSLAQVVLYKIEGNRSIPVAKIPTDSQMENGRRIAPKTVSVESNEGLSSGTYEIVVNARTLDDLDISNTEPKYRGRFSVSPVPPLQEIENLSISPELMDIAYLSNTKNPRTFTTRWNAVPNATDYNVRIADSRNNTLYEERINSSETSYILDIDAMDASMKEKFLNGTFTVYITALRRVDYNKDGILDRVLQRSPTENVSFKMNVANPTKTRGKKGGLENPYAR
jgi:hypothetical protein